MRVMRSARAWFIRLLDGLFRTTRRERELAAEMESHLLLHIDDNIRAGMTPDQARRDALIMLGGVEPTKERYRDRIGIPTLDSLLQDVKHGARVLRKAPGFALGAIVVLALGIGANTAIFSLVHAVILQPLPYPDADRIMRVWHVPPPHLFHGRTTFAVSPANYLDWRAENRVFDRMAIYSFRRLNLTGYSDPDMLLAGIVSTDFFAVLGARPRAGRTFLPEEEQPGRHRVVVLSDALWRSRFGSDEGLVGRTIRLDGEPYTVVGIMPAGFGLPTGPIQAQAWVPLHWTDKDRAVRGNHGYIVVAHLKSGVTVKQAQSEMMTISARLEKQFPEDNTGWGAVVIPLHDDIVKNVRPALFVLLGAVALVLLIACANLANLLLAKTLARGHEIAVRTALGATRGRVIQQILCETVLLGAVGGAVGLLMARTGVALIVDLVGDQLPRAAEVAVNGPVLAFTVAVSLGTGLAAGLLPAWRLTTVKANDALKLGLGRGGSEVGERRTRSVLVVSEVALALILLVGAGLLMRSVWLLQRVDPGIDPHNVLTATLSIPQAKYPEPGQQVRFFQTVLDRVRAVAGVEAAGGVDSLPLAGGSTEPISIEGRPAAALSEQPEVAVRTILPGYITSLRIRLESGRDLTAADTRDRPAAILVSASMVQRFWHDEKPIGKRLTLMFRPGVVREVVGVVADVKVNGLDVAEPVAVVYLPHTQVPLPFASLVIRTSVPPSSLAAAVTHAVHEVDPEQPVLDVQTMDEAIGRSLTRQRLNMFLLAIFAGLALALAGIGIYSVLSYTVRQRVREIGIRMALGAPVGDVLWMIVIEGMKPTLLGMVLGLAGAAALGRVLATLIYGIGTRDVATFVTVTLVVAAVGIVASLFPAYRAMRVDPMAALRCD